MRAQERIVVVEGEIGAGKTELCRALAGELERRGHSVALVLEPVDRWSEVGILPLFYADRARYGYSFQTYVYATRVMAIAAAVREKPDADFYILERSPATDRIFMELQRGLVPDVEMRMYADWCDAFRLMLPLDLTRADVLYLKPSIDACMARQRSRGRAGEDASLEAYQRELRRAHEAFLLGEHPGAFPHMAPSPFWREAVRVLGAEIADCNFKDAGPEKDRVIAEVLATLGL
jgi:deoxyadenosine/deoxycytidine kinase